MRSAHAVLLMILLGAACVSVAQTPPARELQGPSTTWARKVIASVRPNIRVAEVIAGNSTAKVEVRLAADGEIVEARLIKSSGVAAWDQAVMKALERTARLPLDVDGRVPPVVVIAFRSQ